jgi:hypothetical protein
MASLFNGLTDNFLRWMADQVATQNVVLVLCYQNLTPIVTTANASTDVLTATAHGLIAGDPVVLSGNGGVGVMPAPIEANRPYYVGGTIETNTFQLAAYPGGPAIDLTDAGTGTFYVKKLDWGRDVTITQIAATEVANTNNYSRKLIDMGASTRVDIVQGFEAPSPTIISATGGNIVFDSYAFILGGSITYGDTTGQAVYGFGIEDSNITITPAVPRAFPIKTSYANSDYATRVAE